MIFSFDLLINAIVSGILIGAFYAAVTAGVSLSFGILDIVNIAHPAFIILGSYIAYIINTQLRLRSDHRQHHRDARILRARRWHLSNLLRVVRETRPGIVAWTRVLLRPVVHHRSITRPLFRRRLPLRRSALYRPDLALRRLDIPLRILVPCLVSLLLIAALQLVLTRTFIGRAIMAVAQDQLALKLMAVDPIRIKRIAFGISIATASLAGAFLIIIQPVEPSVGREYIGRVFAICVLGGMGSLPGTVIAAMLVGIVESLTSTFYGPSWAPAVSFGFLLLTLAVRPAGLLGR